MADLDRRVKVLGAVLRRLGSITSMSPEGIARAQQPGPTPAALQWLFGRPTAGVEITDRTDVIAGERRRSRVYRPGAASSSGKPLVVAFHGGGWTLGSVEGGDWLCSAVSAAVDAVVVSVDYRLAPTHRFPVAVDDAYAATLWAVENSSLLGADGDRVALLGDSAGGNLAAAVALLARDRSGPTISAQVLLYPATDLTLSSPSIVANADQPVLSAAELTAFRDHYLGEDRALAEDPRASPLHAVDHRGLPPAVIQVAEHDPLRDDGVRYADVLREAGVPVRLTEYVGTPHGYMSLPGMCRVAQQALHEVVGGLRDLIGTRAVATRPVDPTSEELR